MRSVHVLPVGRPYRGEPGTPRRARATFEPVGGSAPTGKGGLAPEAEYVPPHQPDPVCGPVCSGGCTTEKNSAPDACVHVFSACANALRFTLLHLRCARFTLLRLRSLLYLRAHVLVINTFVGWAAALPFSRFSFAWGNSLCVVPSYEIAPPYSFVARPHRNRR